MLNSSLSHIITSHQCSFLGVERAFEQLENQTNLLCFATTVAPFLNHSATAVSRRRLLCRGRMTGKSQKKEWKGTKEERRRGRKRRRGILLSGWLQSYITKCCHKRQELLELMNPIMLSTWNPLPWYTLIRRFNSSFRANKWISIPKTVKLGTEPQYLV